jgi:hypothetical protein
LVKGETDADVQAILKSIGVDVTIKPPPEGSACFESEVVTWGRWSAPSAIRARDIRRSIS